MRSGTSSRARPSSWPSSRASICLVNRAIIACLNGLNGLFYTLEVSEEIVHARIDDRRLEYGDVYEQIRGIGKKFNIAMCTASQANRDSLRKRDVDIDSMAEDFSKAMTADYVIGLSQDKREAEEKAPDGRGTGKLRWFIAKNRNGKKGESIEMMTDFTRMRASVADWDRFDAEVYGAPGG